LGLGSELETEQASQPLTLICPLNLAQKDKEWTKVGLKWKCKVDTCVSHTDTTMCGSLNFQELHQGYLSGVKLLRAFSDFISNDECVWCEGGLFSFLKCIIGE